MRKLPGEYLQRQAPAEGLHVDHRIQAPRQQQPQRQRQDQREYRQQPGLAEVEQHQLSARHAQRPQRRELAESALALGQQADEQRHARDAKGQAVQRGGGSEGAFEDLAGPPLELLLVDDAAVFQGELTLHFTYQRRHVGGRYPQVEACR